MCIDGPAAVPTAARDRRAITVLHVDDDLDLVDLAATLLERENDRLTVRTETSVDAALALLNDGDASIDCVVSDYDMPGRDGLDLLRAVRDRAPDLPFILFTGKGSEEIASEAISAGVTDYLQKGQGTDQYAVLANRIQNAVSKYDAERMVEEAYGAMDTAREGIALLDEEGYFRYVNQAYAEITGYERGALVGEHWELLYPDASVDRVYDEILPTVVQAGHWSGQTVYERADGERIPTSHALAYTDDETLICLVQDLSEGADERRTRRRDRPQFDLFVDAVAEYAIFTLDDDGCITSWNGGAERRYGYTADRILGEHVSTLYMGANRPEELLATAGETGMAEDEAWCLRSDGQRFPVHVVVAPIDGDADGRHRGYAMIVRDRGAAAEARVIADALDALDDLFYVLDADGDIVYVNERGAEVTGYSRGEITSMTVTDLFDPADRDDVRESVERALEDGGDVRELRLRAADGSRRTYEFSSQTLDDDHDGTPRRLVGIARNVSDRKARERALNELHRTTRRLMRADSTTEIAELTTEALAEILTLTHTAIHFHDEREGTLVPVAWTRKVEQVIGDPPDLGPGSIAWEAFQHREHRRYDDLQEAETLHNEETVLRSELIVPLGDHGVALVASTEPGAFDENDRRLTQLLCENATAALERVTREEMLRQREDELERENERLDEFASLVSHDLRNPLNVASGHLELAGEECDSDHLGEAGRALKRMETLIDDVLALTREGKSVDETESVDLSTVVERCWANVETADADLHLVDGCTIRADRSRLAQVFENLFRNSVEHGSTSSQAAPDDSVEHGSTGSRTQSDDTAERGSATERIVITVGTIDGPNGRPCGFFVEDDGVGIPEEHRDRVFEAGYSTSGDGTGFGLRIVRDIVEAHGWRIDLTTGRDGGTRFEITGVETA